MRNDRTGLFHGQGKHMYKRKKKKKKDIAFKHVWLFSRDI